MSCLARFGHVGLRRIIKAGEGTHAFMHESAPEVVGHGERVDLSAQVKYRCKRNLPGYANVGSKCSCRASGGVKDKAA